MSPGLRKVNPSRASHTAPGGSFQEDLMKKLLFVAFIFAAVSAFADEPSILDAEFQLKGGYMPIDKLDLNNAHGYCEADFFTDLSVRLILFNLFFVDGEMACNFTLKSGNANFTPYFMNFQVGGGIKIGGLEAGYRHACYHPVLNFSSNNCSLNGGGFDEFYISFKGKVKIF
jgi:hypothetical protein